MFVSSVFLFLTDHLYDLSSLNLSLLSPEGLEDYVDLDFFISPSTLLERDFSIFTIVVLLYQMEVN